MKRPRSNLSRRRRAALAEKCTWVTRRLDDKPHKNDSGTVTATMMGERLIVRCIFCKKELWRETTDG